MENPSRRRRNIRGEIEANTLAFLDASDAKDSRDANDDRIAFLDAVRASSIVHENRSPPTYKMYEAIFQILRSAKSLELIMASYNLLNELDKHFPLGYMTGAEKPSASPELSMVEEAWTPFVLSSEFGSCDRSVAEKNSRGPLSPSDFHLLVQEIAVVADEANLEAIDAKSLRNMLLFQYLVNVLEGDFLLRNSMYRETMNWILVRDSLLNICLCSRRMNYKGLMNDCLTIICGLGKVHDGFSNAITGSVAKVSDTYDTSVAIALPEVRKSTHIATQKFMILVMELDTSKKLADMQCHTTRADAVRTPLVGILLDELTYNKEIFSPFFQVFEDPKWKLELIVQYLWKYIPKPSVRTRKSNGPTGDTTFYGALASLSNSTTTKIIIKKIGHEVVQLLLAHGFQACLLLSPEQVQQSVKSLSDSKDHLSGHSLAETCKNLVSAFNCLRTIDEHMEILSFAKEAIFAAATILSIQS